MIRWLQWGLRLIVVLGLIVWNIRPYTPGNLETVMAQLRFLEASLEAGSARDMQRVFPEGFLFTWALYGMASAQVARQLPEGDARRTHALQSAFTALERVDSDEARSTFVADMEPAYGVFYNAWRLYLQSAIIRAWGIRQVPPALLEGFERNAQAFAQALERSGTPFLPSYPNQSWPADTAVGVAALGVHDAMLKPLYGTVISRWVRDARARLDPKLGVLSHQVASDTGLPSGGVRGGSLALISLVLVDVDAGFAREQYEVLRQQFMDSAWGIPGVREYPEGETGSGDIDSGPIVFGYSGPAIVVGAGAARVNGDEHSARTLFGLVETGGFATQPWGQRRFLGGFVPVGDAFVAWARAARPLTRDLEARAWAPVFSSGWAIPIHVGSLLVVAGLFAGTLRGRWRSGTLRRLGERIHD